MSQAPKKKKPVKKVAKKTVKKAAEKDDGKIEVKAKFDIKGKTGISNMKDSDFVSLDKDVGKDDKDSGVIRTRKILSL